MNDIYYIVIIFLLCMIIILQNKCTTRQKGNFEPDQERNLACKDIRMKGQLQTCNF